MFLEINFIQYCIVLYCIEGSSTSKCRRLAIEDTIVEKGRLKFTDIAGLNEAKETLKEAIIMPLLYPHLFTGIEPTKYPPLHGYGALKIPSAHRIPSRVPVLNPYNAFSLYYRVTYCCMLTILYYTIITEL